MQTHVFTLANRLVREYQGRREELLSVRAHAERRGDRDTKRAAESAYVRLVHMQSK